MFPPTDELDRSIILKRIAEQENNFLLTQRSIEHLKKEGMELEPGSEEWTRVGLLIQESYFVISHNYARLALLKASLGIVGKKWYNEKAGN